MSILKLLASDGFLSVNKYLASELGLDAALMLAELASTQNYMESKEMLDEDGMFFETADYIEDNTTLTQYQQAKAIKVLEDRGLVKTCRKGVPAKKYFAINEDNVTALFQNKFSKNLKTRSEKTSKLDTKKLENINKNREQKNREIRIENNIPVSESFEKLWSIYPRKQGKKKAFDSYKSAVRDGVSDGEIEDGIYAYIRYIEETHTEPQYIKQGSTFFSQRAWGDDWTPTKAKSKLQQQLEDMENWGKSIGQQNYIG